MHHQFRLASICLLLSVVAVAPACSQEGLTILPTRDSSSLSEVPGSPTTSRGNTGIPVVSPRESQTQIMGSPACELSPPLPPGVASFRYGPTHNPDSVQEILTATPLGQTIGGGNVLPDFGSTIGQQMSPAKPVASPSTTSAREGSIAGASVLATAMFAG